MKKEKGVITMKGNPLTLRGKSLKVGDRAPDITVLDNNLSPVTLAAYKGKICVISSVPSLDTPVCDMETRRFNQEASGLGSNVAILTISMDLPFAQKRWCGANGVSKVQTLSDHRDASFGTAYGVLVKELRRANPRARRAAMRARSERVAAGPLPPDLRADLIREAS